MRALILTALVPVLLAARPAGAAGLCDRLAVPEGYTLACETRVEDGSRPQRVVVRPSGGPVSLAELTLRRLDKAEEPLAWEEPELWLTEQVTVDLSGITSLLRSSSETGPLAQPFVRATVDGLIAMLAGWSQLPRQACTPDNRPGLYQLRCDWGITPLELRSTQRLVAAGDERYAIGFWAADERELRHLEAIANSFDAAGGTP
jgi:hypothetical protein